MQCSAVNKSLVKLYTFGITCVLPVNQSFCKNICRDLVRVVSVLIVPLTSDQIQGVKGGKYTTFWIVLLSVSIKCTLCTSLLCSTIHYGTVQYSTLQYSIYYSAVLCNTLQFSRVQYCTAPQSMYQSAVQYSSVNQSERNKRQIQCWGNSGIDLTTG